VSDEFCVNYVCAFPVADAALQRTADGKLIFVPEVRLRPVSVRKHAFSVRQLRMSEFCAFCAKRLSGSPLANTSQVRVCRWVRGSDVVQIASLAAQALTCAHE
jgi:hypothetical protein